MPSWYITEAILRTCGIQVLSDWDLMWKEAKVEQRALKLKTIRKLTALMVLLGILGGGIAAALESIRPQVPNCSHATPCSDPTSPPPTWIEPASPEPTPTPTLPPYYRGKAQAVVVPPDYYLDLLGRSGTPAAQLYAGDYVIYEPCASEIKYDGAETYAFPVLAVERDGVLTRLDEPYKTAMYISLDDLQYLTASDLNNMPLCPGR